MDDWDNINLIFRDSAGNFEDGRSLGVTIPQRILDSIIQQIPGVTVSDLGADELSRLSFLCPEPEAWIPFTGHPVPRDGEPIPDDVKDLLKNLRTCESGSEPLIYNLEQQLEIGWNELSNIERYFHAYGLKSEGVTNTKFWFLLPII